MSDEIKEAVSKAIGDNHLKDRIQPSWVANAAMRELDPKRDAPPAVYWGCAEYTKQVARGQLRGQFADVDENNQHDLFPELQKKYPTEHIKGCEPEYVRLEVMSEADKDYNVRRLRAEGKTKIAHAKALSDWWERQHHARTG